MGFGNTVNPPKKEDDFLNNAMSSLYSVRNCLELSELLFSSGLAPVINGGEKLKTADGYGEMQSIGYILKE